MLSANAWHSAGSSPTPQSTAPLLLGGPQRSGALPHHSKADEKDKMEVQFAFFALAFFAAFMAARSLTAYFKQK